MLRPMWGSEARLKPRESLIMGGICLLLAYFGWLGGCAFMPAELTLGWVGLALLLLTIFLPFDPEHPPTEARNQSRWPVVALLKDPIFALGLLFMLLLAVQAINAGRPAPLPAWPSSVNRSEAVRMLHWFLPAWALIVAIRNRLLSSTSRTLLARFVSLIAGVLALFGIVQMALASRWGYGLGELPERAHFFASFGYANHAGAYFVLAFALGAGLLLDDLFGRGPGWTLWRVLLTLSALLCLVAASLSFSHAGLILSLGAALLASAVGMLLSWKQWGPVARFNVVLSIGAFAALVFFLVSGVGESEAERHGQSMFGKFSVADKVEGRLFMSEAAVRIWQEHPWFGVGGWGYRSLMASYIDEADWGKMGAGQANAHCDPLQFLAEFGVVGSALLLGVIATMLIPLLRSGAWQRPGVFVLLVGLLATVVHSLVDLPFRNPAILCTWAVIIAIYSRSSSSPVVFDCLPATLGHGGQRSRRGVGSNYDG